MGKGEKEILLKTNIKRERGYLYFAGTDEKTGCITIGRSKMKHYEKWAKK